MNDSINILIACDKNYAPYYGVMLTSLLINNVKHSFHIHWITDKYVPHEEKDKFAQLVKEHNSLLSIYEIDNSKLTDFPQTAHINYAAYYNLKASEILPCDVHRIIYLDGDMIVNGDIRSLWELDLQGNANAQVLGGSYLDKSLYERLNYADKYGYYNNGVVLYDFDKLREMQFSQKAIQYVIDNQDVKWMDQDTINALLYDKTLRLPLKYNFQTLFFTREFWQGYDVDFKKQILTESLNPIIIHYNGMAKPWDFYYYGCPWGTIWKRYCKLSKWSNAQRREPKLKYLKYITKRIIWPGFFKQKHNAKYINESWDLR